jgi:hypothetical protein
LSEPSAATVKFCSKCLTEYTGTELRKCPCCATPLEELHKRVEPDTPQTGDRQTSLDEVVPVLREVKEEGQSTCVI